MCRELMCLILVLGVTVSAGGVELITAEDLLVDLRAEDLAYGTGVTTWTNHGSTAGDFTATESGDPIVVENVAGAKAVTLNGGDRFDGPISPDGIEGDGTRSIEVWAYNPSMLGEETMVAWAHRGGGDGTNMAFNYSDNTSWGSVGHWGGSHDMGWWTNHIPAPAVNTWWYLVYTFDGTAARVYVNGVEESVRDGIALASHADSPIKIGTQNNDTAGSPSSHYFSGSIAVVRIHDGVLSPADIVNNFQVSPVGGASVPIPADGSTAKPTVSGANVYVVLNYTPGEGAIKHTGYFSDNYESRRRRQSGRPNLRARLADAVLCRV